jgi:hypothetical protein
MTSTLPKGTLGSVASLLAETLDLDLDRNHNLWNIVSSERYILHMIQGPLKKKRKEASTIL